MRVYVIGSMRNEKIPEVAQALRQAGHQVFDEWFSPGPEADDYWQKHSRGKGLSFKDALNSQHAKHVFYVDKKFLDMADAAVLVAPAGRSAHIELGYMAGCGKKTFYLFDEIPERYDVMLNFCTDVCFSVPELVDGLKNQKGMW